MLRVYPIDGDLLRDLVIGYRPAVAVLLSGTYLPRGALSQVVQAHSSISGPSTRCTRCTTMYPNATAAGT